MGFDQFGNRRRGLTAFQLKVMALVFMTLDHIGAFAFEIPVVDRYGTYLRSVGRLAAPLFLFLLVQSIRHTRSKPRFLLRLYLAGVCTGLFVTVMNLCLGEVFCYFTPGNVIFTFFYVALYVILLERLWAAWKARDPRGLAVSALLLAATLLPTALAMPIRGAVLPSGVSIQVHFLVSGLYDSLLPTFYSIEYGIGFVILGVAMYFAKTKNRQCLVFAVFCAICIAVTLAMPWLPFNLYGMQTFGFALTFLNTMQCRMALALPLMLLYNGERGRRCKWFFYWYYPLHREVIFVISALVAP